LHVEARAATKAQTDAVQFRIPVNADPDTRDVRPIETTPAPSDVESATGGEQAVEVETSDVAEPITAEPIADETPQDAPTYLDRGEALASSARLNDAIAAYDRALELDPKLVDAYVGRGFVLAHTGASEAAIDNFAAALRLAPNHPRAHFGLGRALRQQGHYAEAVAHLERAIQLNPELGSAYVELIRAQRAWEVSIEAARAAQQ
jgi:tetratricopeptide (TPR) repeat protein